MEQMSRTERAALCNSALEAGEDAPTLCEGWTVKDLVIHLLECAEGLDLIDHQRIFLLVSRRLHTMTQVIHGP